MNKILALIPILLTATTVLAAKPSYTCVTLQDGILTYPEPHYLSGQTFKVGYDIFGNNYQAHIFKGYHANFFLGREGFPPYEGDTEAYLASNPEVASKSYWPYRDDWLIVKWNDELLSNKDCGTQVGLQQYTDVHTPDGKLDRHYPSDSYIGSGAWETNHQYGSYEKDGKICYFNYFAKMVAAPEGATAIDGNWTLNGKVIGPQIWGDFAIIEQVYKNPCEGYGGILYNSLMPKGFGYYKP